LTLGNHLEGSFEDILDAAGIEDFSVMTDASVTIVATDVLRRSGWIDDSR
jgi:hypothetical protein